MEHPSNTQRFLVRAATVSSTGADGGHRYLRGRCEWEGSDVDVAVLFASRSDEKALTPGDVVVEATVSDFTKGTGLLLSDARLVSDQ